MIIVCLVIGMRLTPQDIASQLIMAVPLYLLFELCLVILRMDQRKAEREATPAAGRDASRSRRPTCRWPGPWRPWIRIEMKRGILLIPEEKQLLDVFVGRGFSIGTLELLGRRRTRLQASSAVTPPRGVVVVPPLVRGEQVDISVSST